MNKKFITLFMLMMCVTASTFAQQSKSTPTKTAPKSSNAISAADRDKANKMIMYTNSLQDFMSQYIPINTISLPLNNYSESLQTESVYLNPETLGENFKTVGEAITQYKNDKGSNPTEPAAIIGGENQAFIKSKIVECSNLYEKIKSLNNSLKPYTQGDMIEKSNLPKVKSIVNEMYETLDKIYDVHEALYDRMDDIGMQAEAITLSNHPMKTEILDMKNVMNKSKKVFKLVAQSSPNEAKEKIQEIKSVETQVHLIQNKYGENYSAEGAGKNNSIELRSAVKRFYEQVTNYYWHLEELMTELEKNKIEKDEWSTQLNMQKGNYELMISEYNAFVSANNGE